MENFSFDLVTLLIGLVVGWLLTTIKSFFMVRRYRKELEDYKKHLERQMKITQEGAIKIESDTEKLKKENENLRVTVKTLGQKPGRSELRLLNVYDASLRKMMLKAPGFAQGWELSMQEAEDEYEDHEKGLRTVIKKVFSTGIIHKKDNNISSDN